MPGNKLKILFVSSGNSQNFTIAPFIKSQGLSLEKKGIEISWFTVKRKGFLGYLKAAIELRKYLKGKSFDLIHAHYTLCGWTSVLAFPKVPIVLSLMGSDTYGDYVGADKIKPISYYLIALTKLIQPFVSALICKSKHIQSYVFLKSKSFIIPNGVALGEFKPAEKSFHEELKLSRENNYLLFLGNKDNVRKNYQLAEVACKILKDKDLQLLAPYPVSQKEIVKYLNTVNCLVVTSFMEGSPNVVKEAMACNCPVVSTDVGDVKWLLGEEPGHYLADFTPEEVAKKVKDAIAFSKKKGSTNGRTRLTELGLDEESVSQKIIDVYLKCLKKNESTF